jgi:rhodanese-related sulfurtransferase
MKTLSGAVLASLGLLIHAPVALAEAVPPGAAMGQTMQKMQETMGAAMKTATLVIESGARPGSISVPSFERIRKENPAQMLIVDVRSALEAKKGSFPGAINIPFNELEKRLASLPKDKPVVFACEDGPNAGKALEKAKLLRSDLKAYFLDADVSCNDSEMCIVKAR